MGKHSHSWWNRTVTARRPSTGTPRHRAEPSPIEVAPEVAREVEAPETLTPVVPAEATGPSLFDGITFDTSTPQSEDDDDLTDAEYDAVENSLPTILAGEGDASTAVVSRETGSARSTDRVIEVHVMHSSWDGETTDEPAPQVPAAAVALPVPTAPAATAPSLFDHILVGSVDAEAQPEPEVERPRKPKREPFFVMNGQPLGGAADAAAPRSAKPSRKKPRMDDTEIDPDSPAGVTAQNWFDTALADGIDQRASDLKLTLDGKHTSLVARFRVDGIMRPYATIGDAETARTVMGKFKAAAHLVSGDSFIPEEKIYEMLTDGELRKARVASFRTSDGGTTLALRMPPIGALKTLDELQFAPANLERFRRLLSSSDQMVLVAGPTGSGKTTTVHGALAEIATDERNVWSLEDPVERIIPGITQLEVDEKNGAGFETLLPSLVRGDYDTLFLGEIRDRSTAAAGIRQAKAGQQVLTTIHANNNIIALMRLIELAEDSPLSVLGSVRGVVSQRLVRSLNPNWDGVNPLERYWGRVPIHEVLTLNEDLIEAFMRDEPLSVLRERASLSSEGTFREDAARLVDRGITDAAEIRRVLGNE